MPIIGRLDHLAQSYEREHGKVPKFTQCPFACLLPLRLIDRTHWYAGEERAALVKRRRRAQPGYQAPTALFLNSNGDPVSRARFSAAFGAAFQAAGLRGSGHWLRHTFAMTMLVRLQKQAVTTPDLNPLKIVQVLLGCRFR